MCFEQFAPQTSPSNFGDSIGNLEVFYINKGMICPQQWWQNFQSFVMVELTH